MTSSLAPSSIETSVNHFWYWLAQCDQIEHVLSQDPSPNIRKEGEQLRERLQKKADKYARRILLQAPPGFDVTFFQKWLDGTLTQRGERAPTPFDQPQGQPLLHLVMSYLPKEEMDRFGGSEEESQKLQKVWGRDLYHEAGQETRQFEAIIEEVLGKRIPAMNSSLDLVTRIKTLLVTCEQEDLEEIIRQLGEGEQFPRHFKWVQKLLNDALSARVQRQLDLYKTYHSISYLQQANQIVRLMRDPGAIMIRIDNVIEKEVSDLTVRGEYKEAASIAHLMHSYEKRFQIFEVLDSHLEEMAAHFIHYRSIEGILEIFSFMGNHKDDALKRLFDKLVPKNNQLFPFKNPALEALKIVKAVGSTKHKAEMLIAFIKAFPRRQEFYQEVFEQARFLVDHGLDNFYGKLFQHIPFSDALILCEKAPDFIRVGILSAIIEVYNQEEEWYRRIFPAIQSLSMDFREDGFLQLSNNLPLEKEGARFFALEIVKWSKLEDFCEDDLMDRIIAALPPNDPLYPRLFATSIARKHYMWNRHKESLFRKLPFQNQKNLPLLETVNSLLAQKENDLAQLLIIGMQDRQIQQEAYSSFKEMGLPSEIKTLGFKLRSQRNGLNKTFL